jgi:hypothetical protein
VSTDDELRRILRREATSLGGPDARDALAAIRPAVRRGRRRRIGVAVGTGALVLGSGVVGAQFLRSADDGTIVLDAPTTPPDDRPAGPGHELETVTAPSDGDSGDVTSAPIRSSTSDVVAAGTSGDDRDGLEDPGVEPSADSIPGSNDDDPRDDAPVGTPAPAPVAPPPAPPLATAPPATTAAAPSSAAPTTSAPTTPPPSGPDLQVFESPCGTVTADMSVSPPDLVQIGPAPGYRAVVEDPDHGRITVHFEGGGEDCELKIGGSADHD